MNKKCLHNQIVASLFFLLLLLKCGDAFPKVCRVKISPAKARIETLRTIQFSATTRGERCNEACYTWEVTGCIGSTIDSIGSTINANGLYTAGTTAGKEIVRVTDMCNGGISDAAKVRVLSDLDDEVNCPDSNREPTITIGECDSGVENQLLDNGCTMSDLIAQCAEREFACNHGNFVSCVAHLTDKWKKEGLINGREKGAIQRCAAQSDVHSTTTTTIITSKCASDEECDDGVYCNGAEICDAESGLCQAGTDPCPNDGLFCNGEESCDEVSAACVYSNSPCQSGLACNEESDACIGCSIDEECNDGLYCNGVETCDVGSTVCQKGIDPCPDDELFCNGEESCDEACATCVHSGDPCQGKEICSEETKECMPESRIPTIELVPDSAWRSSLIPLPLIMVITGNNTNFNTTTTVDFSGDDVLQSWHMVLSPTNIFVLSLINSADSEDIDSTEVIVTVISTVDTDEEVATAALTLNLIPGF